MNKYKFLYNLIVVLSISSVLSAMRSQPQHHLSHDDIKRVKDEEADAAWRYAMRLNVEASKQAKSPEEAAALLLIIEKLRQEYNNFSDEQFRAREIGGWQYQPSKEGLNMFEGVVNDYRAMQNREPKYPNAPKITKQQINNIKEIETKKAYEIWKEIEGRLLSESEDKSYPERDRPLIVASLILLADKIRNIFAGRTVEGSKFSDRAAFVPMLLAMPGISEAYDISRAIKGRR